MSPDRVKNLVEGALMARDNARRYRQRAKQWAHDSVYAQACLREAHNSFERAYWALDRAKQWKDAER